MEQPPPLRPLEYRSPAGGREMPTPPFGVAVGALIGFTFYVGALFLLFALGWLLWPRLSAFVAAALCVLAAMVVFSIYANGRWGWRGVFLGMLIGIGLTLLIPGLCFGALMNA